MMKYLRAKKSLGQNFLKSTHALNTMVKLAQEAGNQQVLEIGPGKGALTCKLVEAGFIVTAIELDERMVEYLHEKCAGAIQDGRLKLIHNDVRSIDTKKLFPNTEYTLVANIPYYLTNMIIRKFLTAEKKPTAMILLVQKEVAKRIVASDEKESLLSLSVKFFGDPRFIEKVPKRFFSPVPKVDSAIIAIENIGDTPHTKEEEEKFFSLLHRAFAQKRKQTFKLLRPYYREENLARAFQLCELAENARAEEITLQKWLCLLEKLDK